MTKYWTAKKSKVVVEIRRAELDTLFEFGNADIKDEENRPLETKILDHLYQHSALHPDNRRWKADGYFFKLLNSLQKHLHNRFNEIVKNKNMLWEMPLWKINGSVHLILNPGGTAFQERFQLRKVKTGNEINALKKVLDLWLIEIIRDLDFGPKRFGQCLKCSAFFYNSTIKEKIYCSTRCSNAMHQNKFREKRRG